MERVGKDQEFVFDHVKFEMPATQWVIQLLGHESGSGKKSGLEIKFGHQW